MTRPSKFCIPQQRLAGKRNHILLALLSATLLHACSSDNGGGEVQPGINGSYLFVSVPDFYFGTRDVGTVATQEIEIVNRGGDIYPINSLAISGSDAEEFSTEVYNNVTLNPSEAIKVRITFSPITDGRKFASLDVDFDTIEQVTDAVNQNEQHYYQAKSLEDNKHYSESLAEYDRYIDGRPVTVNKRRASIKLPVIKEAELYGEGDDFELYLSAVNLREAGNLDQAMSDIDLLLLMHADSYIADDALYLRGYIQLMDQQDYASAQKTMLMLRQRHPDTTYYDTALYSEALAHQELGNEAIARAIYVDLKYRHTGIDTLGVTLPKDNVMSRLWFDRANNAIALL